MRPVSCPQDLVERIVETEDQFPSGGPLLSVQNGDLYRMAKSSGVDGLSWRSWAKGECAKPCDGAPQEEPSDRRSQTGRCWKKIREPLAKNREFPHGRSPDEVRSPHATRQRGALKIPWMAPRNV